VWVGDWQVVARVAAMRNLSVLANAPAVSASRDCFRPSVPAGRYPG